MRSSTSLALLFTLSVASLLVVSLASANSVPTRTQSSYGDGPSYIQSTSSSASGGVTINEESFCSFSHSFDTSCALSYAYQIVSPLPAGVTGLTISIAVPAGAVLDTNGSSIGMGILTDDSFGFTGTPNVFYTAGVSAGDLAALPSSETSYGVDGSGDSYITINDPSFLAAHGDGLAFVLDVATDTSGDPFTCGSSGTTPCSSDQIPGDPVAGPDDHNVYDPYAGAGHSLESLPRARPARPVSPALEELTRIPDSCSYEDGALPCLRQFAGFASD